MSDCDEDAGGKRGEVAGRRRRRGGRQVEGMLSSSSYPFLHVISAGRGSSLVPSIGRVLSTNSDRAEREGDGRGKEEVMDVRIDEKGSVGVI